jgi:hypothetical protein
MKFTVGDTVKKTNGYAFEGTVVSVFYNSKKQIRLVVEHKGSQTETSGGMLHIFNENQLELDN